MPVQMARPMRRKESSFIIFRKRPPADVLTKCRGQFVTVTLPSIDGHEGFTISLKIGETIKFSLRTRNPAIAKVRHATVDGQLHSQWEAVRKGPARLTQKQAVALAGTVYRFFVSAFEENPGEAAWWDAAVQDLADIAKGTWLSASEDHASQRGRIIADLERGCGPVVDGLLRKEGLIIDAESRHLLLMEVVKAMAQSVEKLKRNASGDYSPDPMAARFPEWSPPAQLNGRASITITSLLAGWKVEAKTLNLASSTLNDYASRIGIFVRWLTHDDARRVTADDIVRYKDHRLTVVSPKTVKDSDLTTLKTIFGYGVRNRKLPANPAQGITVRAAKRVKVRESYFTETEIKSVLTRSKTYAPKTEREQAKMVAAKRWLPWLCAYTGARVGEMAQLRKGDIFEADGAWFLTITPEAGTVKNKEMRKAPIHDHLIEEGFLDFVRVAKPGYLFLKASDQESALRALRGTKNRVRELIRTVVHDPGVAPNHGWRHTFKTIALEAEIDSQVADSICGHARAQSVGDSYRHPSLKTKAAAIRKFPRYRLSD